MAGFMRGFTLVELVVTMVLIGIIAGVLAPFIYQATEGFTDTRARAELVGKGRLALERLARDLRQADPGTVRVQGDRLDYTRVTVDFADADADLTVDYRGGVPHKTYLSCTPVTVEKNADRLLWSENGAQGVLLDGVASVDLVANTGDARRPEVVAITLELEEGDSSIELHREVHVRNTQGDACP